KMAKRKRDRVSSGKQVAHAIALSKEHLKEKRKKGHSYQLTRIPKQLKVVPRNKHNRDLLYGYINQSFYPLCIVDEDGNIVNAGVPITQTIAWSDDRVEVISQDAIANKMIYWYKEIEAYSVGTMIITFS